MEELKDKYLICKDCHRKFTFTIDEQKDFGQKGWNDPVRCKYCRRMKNILSLKLNEGVDISDEIRFNESCDKCGRPFLTRLKRRKGINLYCDDCWDEIKHAKPIKPEDSGRK